MADTGALTEAVYYILLSLVQPRHGYAIMQRVAHLSRGRVRLAAGTLYGALATLVSRAWIEELPADPDSRTRQYALTAAGRTVLIHELERLEELVANGQALIEGRHP
jgi:DNA-binding PadR family transcriptional regulator